MKVGVAKETAPGERRVALVPEVLGKLQAAGLEVLVESRRRRRRRRSPMRPTRRPARRSSRPSSCTPSRTSSSGSPSRPSPRSRVMRSGQAVIGFLAPLIDPATAQALADAGRDGDQPRRDPADPVARADDGCAELAGQRRRLQGRAASPPTRTAGYFPLLTTAAGTAKPANVLILGIGVAGLQAIGTARRLGRRRQRLRRPPRDRASRPRSLGAKFVKLKTTIDATGAGGYARELTAEERAAQQAELNEVIGGMDVVITTAQVPGRKPPVLVTADAVGRMKSGSVIVDMAASALGGNCELSQAGQTIDDRQRRHDHRPGQPAGDRCRPARPPSTPATSRRCCSGWSRTATSTSTSRTRSRRRRSSRTAARWCREPVKKLLEPGPRGRSRRPRVSPEVRDFLLNASRSSSSRSCAASPSSARCPATLHTPLMSGANSIHGIVLVGSMFIAVEATDLAQPGPVAGRRRLRDDERRRRLRRHRPDAPDVPASKPVAPEAGRARRRA